MRIYPLGTIFILAAGILASSFLSSSTSLALASAQASQERVQTREFYQLVNRWRVQNGRKALRVNSKLARGAKAYSLRMTREAFYGHRDPQGRDLSYRIHRSGYASLGWIWGGGENLMWSTFQDSRAPQQAFRKWLDSAPHRANMLVRDWRDMGVAFSPGSPVGTQQGEIWVLWLARRDRT